MPRQKATTPRSQQLLVRVTEEELDILDAAGFLERQTANAYVYRLVQAHVAALRSNAAVMNAVALRTDYDSSQGATVPMPTQGDRPAAGSVREVDETSG